MEVRCDELVREALSSASKKDMCPLCRAKVGVAKITHRLLGPGLSVRLLGLVGRCKRLLVDAAGARRGAPGSPEAGGSARPHEAD